jgi:RNA polymerase-binding transcription factor DksA
VEGDPAPARDTADEFAILDRVQTELDDVSRALQRLDDGTYGTCEVCGSKIDDEHLEAQPAARWCAEHRPAAT